jgi:PadR family transcriptional regulator, regulatory protein AphA
VAPLQVEAHRQKLAEYEALRDSMPESVPEGPRLALDAGIANARQQIEWWGRLVANDGQ